MKVVRTGYGKKIGNSFIGALIGIIMFIASFVVLYINEGRENAGKVAESVTEITAGSTVDNGTFVCIRGNLAASVYASDEYLAAGEYITLNRKVEMYAYEEKEHKSSHDNVGGSTTTTYTYTYETEWIDSPKATSSFEGDSNEIPSNIPSDYNNWIASKPANSKSTASGLTLEGFTVGENLDFSGLTNLTLSETVAETSDTANSTVTTNYIYIGNQGTVSSTAPKLGDIRISYSILTTENTGMLLGEINNNIISGFTTPEDNTIFRFFGEADSKAEAISTLSTEHKTMTWILRLVGFMLMFIGILLMGGPITNTLSVIPVLSKISGFLFGVVAFIVALVLTVLTILLSIIFHNFWLALLFVAAVILIVILVIKKKKKKALASRNYNRYDDNNRYDNDNRSDHDRYDNDDRR